MTIDEKIKQAAEGQSMRLTSSLIDADTRARIFTNGANLVKTEMLADMQKLADALENIETYNCGSDGFSAPTIESNYKTQIARQALAEFNAKYKGEK